MQTDKQTGKTISLRIPVPLKEWLDQRARRQDRSLNYVVTKLIEQAKAEQELRS